VAQPRLSRRPSARTITPWPSGKMKRSTCISFENLLKSCRPVRARFHAGCAADKLKTAQDTCARCRLFMTRCRSASSFLSLWGAADRAGARTPAA